MSFSRRQLVRLAATGTAAGLAGCQGLIGNGVDDGGSIEAEVSVAPRYGRDGTPFVIVRWTVNQHANYLTVSVENTDAGQSVETALCGVGASLTLDGQQPAAQTNGPVGDPPDCESGSPASVGFGPGDQLEIVVTAHAGGDATKELANETFTFPTPTPTPTGDG